VPLLRILVLAFALAHASGLSDALELACPEVCDDGDCEDGACPPLCPSCHGVRCPAGVATAVVTVEPNRPPPAAAGFAEVVGAVSSPDPREILRVPIALPV